MEEENYDNIRSQLDNDVDSINNQVIDDNKTSNKSENNNLTSEKSTDDKKHLMIKQAKTYYNCRVCNKTYSNVKRRWSHEKMCYKYLTDTPTALRNEVKPKQEEVLKPESDECGKAAFGNRVVEPNLKPLEKKAETTSRREVIEAKCFFFAETFT